MTRILVTRKDSLEKKHKNKHVNYEYNQYEVTKRSDFNQCYVAFYEIMPGKANYPFHYHENNSEVFYIIEGEGQLQTKDGFVVIKAGDVIVCPKGEEGLHKIKNTSNEILRYIDIDTTNSPDVVHYPDSNKTGVIIHNQSSAFYKNGSEVDYYLDE